MEYCRTYRQVKRRLDGGFRAWLRESALDGLALWDRLIGAREALSRPRIQFLYVHHCFPDEEQNLHVLLEMLSERHEFISYSAAVRKILDREIDRPYVVFSSDDGFHSNLRLGRVLREYGVSACFFLNPALIGEERPGVLEPHFRDRLHFPPVELMDWDEVGDLQVMGHEIGSHTMNHINVADTPAEQVREEVERSREELHRRCGEARHFSFPYGRFFHFNEEGRQAVFDAGYGSCASAERACHINHPAALPREELCIRRNNLVLGWDPEHILYFMVRNARDLDPSDNLFPWREEASDEPTRLVNI